MPYNKRLVCSNKQGGRRVKEKSLKELTKEVKVNSSDLDSLYTRIDRLEKMIHELAEQTDTYLPSFASKVWKK
tara:strand:+ start:209 stop:427 length:219 start_codon:yes stop_codon:yes gene_type:complete